MFCFPQCLSQWEVEEGALGRTWWWQIDDRDESSGPLGQDDNRAMDDSVLQESGSPIKSPDG